MGSPFSLRAMFVSDRRRKGAVPRAGRVSRPSYDARAMRVWFKHPHGRSRAAHSPRASRASAAAISSVVGGSALPGRTITRQVCQSTHRSARQLRALR